MGERVRVVLMLLVAVFGPPSTVLAQERAWIGEVSLGLAGFVDDATKTYVLFGGSVRRALSPRISIGPELVVMSNDNELRDRNVLLTGNLVVDVRPTASLSPFIVAGGGMFWGRERFVDGPFWSSDPAFTAGAGVRANLSDRLVGAVEYRLGWELHHRFSGSAGFRW